jgi:hypothetical protein
LVLVICEEWDFAALWAADQLRSRGVVVDILTSADLAAAERWEHRLGQASVTFALTLAGGERCMSSQMVRGALNRLSFLPSAWLQRIGGPDRDYAIQEMHALYLSWLAALPGPVLNRPTPQGLCGNWRHPSAWAALAGRAGLPTARYCQSSEDDPSEAWQPAGAPPAAIAFVVGERVIAPPALPTHFYEACRRLANSAGARLLGIDFLPATPGEWRFTGASVMPDLVRGGEPLADALAEAFA